MVCVCQVTLKVLRPRRCCYDYVWVWVGEWWGGVGGEEDTVSACHAELPWGLLVCGGEDRGRVGKGRTTRVIWGLGLKLDAGQGARPRRCRWWVVESTPCTKATGQEQ